MQKFLLPLFFALLIHLVQVQAQSPTWQWAKSACALSVATSVTAIATDTSGNIFIAGNFRDSAQFGNTVFHPVGTANLFLAKYDSMANFLWMRSASGQNIPPYDLITDICTDLDGNCYITGFFNGQKLIDHDTLVSMGSNPDVFAAKFGPSGNLVWVHQGLGGGSDYANGIGLDAAGNCYVAGSFQQSVSFGTFQLSAANGSTDVFILKLDAAGNITSAQRYGGSDAEQLNSMAVNDDGNCFLAGTFTSPDFILGNDTLPYSNTAVDAFFASVDSAGISLWGRTGYGPSNQEPSSIAAGPGGSCFVTGVFKGDTMYLGPDTLVTFGYWDFFTAAYDSTGDLLLAGHQGSTSFGTENSNAIVADDTGRFFTTGVVRNPGNFPPLNVSSTAQADVFVTGFDPAGNAEWVMQSGTPFSVLSATALCMDARANLFISGSYESSTTFAGDSLLTPPGYTAGYYIAKLGYDDFTGVLANSISVSVPQIYPNPASTMLFIKGGSSVLTARIYDVAGNLVKETGFEPGINIADLAPSVYILEIRNGMETYRARFIKH